MHSLTRRDVAALGADVLSVRRHREGSIGSYDSDAALIAIGC